MVLHSFNSINNVSLEEISNGRLLIKSENFGAGVFLVSLYYSVLCSPLSTSICLSNQCDHWQPDWGALVLTGCEAERSKTILLVYHILCSYFDVFINPLGAKGQAYGIELIQSQEEIWICVWRYANHDAVTRIYSHRIAIL